MSILINLGPNLAIYAKNQMEQNSKTIKNLAHLTIYVKMGNNAVKKKKPSKAYNNKFFKA